MNRSIARCGFLLVLLPALIGLHFGCFEISRETPIKRSFAIQLNNPTPHSEELFSGVLKVRRFRVATRYNQQGLIYQRSDVSFESDFYNEWLTGPAENLTQESRLWLDRRKTFVRTVELSSQVRGEFVLEAQVNRLYADLRGTPQAVLEIQFFLLDRDSVVLLDRTYVRELQLPNDEPASIVQGLTRGLQEILMDLDADLSEHRAEIRPPETESQNGNSD